MEYVWVLGLKLYCWCVCVGGLKGLMQAQNNSLCGWYQGSRAEICSWLKFTWCEYQKGRQVTLSSEVKEVILHLSQTRVAFSISAGVTMESRFLTRTNLPFSFLARRVEDSMSWLVSGSWWFISVTGIEQFKRRRWKDATLKFFVASATVSNTAVVLIVLSHSRFYLSNVTWINIMMN